MLNWSVCVDAGKADGIDAALDVKSITTNLQIEILEYQLRLDIIFSSQTTRSLQKYT